MGDGAADGERLHALLHGLRSIADTSDPGWRPDPADVRAVVEGAWDALADLLDDKPHAGAVLEQLRRLTLLDAAMTRTEGRTRRLGEVLERLEYAPATMAELVNLGP